MAGQEWKLSHPRLLMQQLWRQRSMFIPCLVITMVVLAGRTVFSGGRLVSDRKVLTRARAQGMTVYLNSSAEEVLTDLAATAEDAGLRTLNLYVGEGDADSGPVWRHGKVATGIPGERELPYLLVGLSAGLRLSRFALETALRAAELVSGRNDVFGICLDGHSLQIEDHLFLTARRCEHAVLLLEPAQRLADGGDFNPQELLGAAEERNMLVGFTLGAYASNETRLLTSFPAALDEVHFVPKLMTDESDFAKANREGLGQLLNYSRRYSTGRMLLSVINRNFVPFARSWMCNQEVLGFHPEHVLWVATDQEAYDAMSSVEGAQTIFLHGMGRQEETEEGLNFGTPGYWDLMLSRAKLVRELLDRGVSVLVFDADQTWLQDPMPTLEEALGDPRVDVIGTLVTGDEIGGNFVFLRATNHTQVMYHDLCDNFEGEFLARNMDTRTDTNKELMPNDQTILSHFVYKNKQYAAKYQCEFVVLDRDLYLDGIWYRGKYEDRPRTHYPIVVNNNYISGLANKQKRAVEFGHWFLDDDGVTCIRPEEVRGLPPAA